MKLSTMFSAYVKAVTRFDFYKTQLRTTNDLIICDRLMRKYYYFSSIIERKVTKKLKEKEERCVWKPEICHRSLWLVKYHVGCLMKIKDHPKRDINEFESCPYCGREIEVVECQN